MSEGPVTRRKRSLGSTGSPIDTPPSSLVKRQRLPNGESASRSNSRASVNGSDDGGDHSDKDLGSRDSNDEGDEEEGDWGDPLGADADSSARGVDGGRSLRRKDSGFGGEKAATRSFYPTREAMMYWLQWIHGQDPSKICCERCVAANRRCSWVKGYAKCAFCEKRRVACSTFLMFVADWKKVRATFIAPAVPLPPFPPGQNHPCYLPEDDTLHPNNYSRPPSDPNPRLYTVLLSQLEEEYNKGPKPQVPPPPQAVYVPQPSGSMSSFKVNPNIPAMYALEQPSTSEKKEHAPVVGFVEPPKTDIKSPPALPISTSYVAPRLYRQIRGVEAHEGPATAPILRPATFPPVHTTTGVERYGSISYTEPSRPSPNRVDVPQSYTSPTPSADSSPEKLRLQQVETDNKRLEEENKNLRRELQSLRDNIELDKQKQDDLRERYSQLTKTLAFRESTESSAPDSSTSSEELEKLNASVKQRTDALQNLCEEILSLDPFAPDVSSILMKRHSMSMFYSASLVMANLPRTQGTRKTFECTQDQEKFMVKMYEQTLKDRRF